MAELLIIPEEAMTTERTSEPLVAACVGRIACGACPMAALCLGHAESATIEPDTLEANVVLTNEALLADEPPTEQQFALWRLDAQLLFEHESPDIAPVRVVTANPPMPQETSAVVQSFAEAPQHKPVMPGAAEQVPSQKATVPELQQEPWRQPVDEQPRIISQKTPATTRALVASALQAVPRARVSENAESYHEDLAGISNRVLPPAPITLSTIESAAPVDNLVALAVQTEAEASYASTQIALTAIRETQVVVFDSTKSTPTLVTTAEQRVVAAQEYAAIGPEACASDGEAAETTIFAPVINEAWNKNAYTGEPDTNAGPGLLPADEQADLPLADTLSPLEHTNSRLDSAVLYSTESLKTKETVEGMSPKAWIDDSLHEKVVSYVQANWVVPQQSLTYRLLGACVCMLLGCRLNLKGLL